jgi:hypothetical protein
MNRNLEMSVLPKVQVCMSAMMIPVRGVKAMSFTRFIALLALPVMLLLGACASTSTPTAVTDFNRSFDFSGVRKIALQPINRTVITTVNVSDMQESRINEAVQTELQRRGFELVSDNADADMFLTWHLVTQERTDVRTFNTGSGYNCWNCGGSSVSVRQFTQGTFIVDMIDPVQLRSVWRSTFESRMRSEPDRERAAENRRAAAEAIFRNFPPGAGGS